MASTSNSSYFSLPVTALGAAVTGLALYAVYFDHRRQTDPEFRRKLKIRRAEWEQEKGRRQLAAEEKNNVKLIARAREILLERPPTSPSEVEEYFMQNVSAAEGLLKMGDKTEAATRFFRAYLVYRNKKTLLDIYSSSIAPDVLKQVKVMIAESDKTLSLLD